MGVFDQFIVGPDVEQPATGSVPPETPPAGPGSFNQFIRGPDAQPAAPAAAPQFNQPFGELKPYTPSWSEWIGNKLQDVGMAAGADPYAAGHLGHGVRDVLMASPAGVPVAAADVGFYSGKGDYGNAALNALSLIPAARLGGAVARGEATTARNLPLNFAENPAAEFRPSPSSEQLTKSGASGFQTFRSSGQEYPPADIAALANDMKTQLNAKGQYEKAAPLAHDAIDVLANKAQNNPTITAPDLDELRLALSQSGKKGEPGGQIGKSVLYDYLKSTGDTTMERAVGDYGAGARGKIVDTILSKAARSNDEARALAAQTRSQVQSLEQRPRGFTGEEVGALDTAREGSPTVRGLETASNVIGGTNVAGKLVRASLAGGGGFLGFGIGGPAAALVPESASWALRTGAGSLRRSGVEEAGNLVRQRSPMYETAKASGYAGVEPAASGPAPSYYGPGAAPGGGTPPISPLRLKDPSTPAQSFVMRNAIAQALLNKYRGQ